MNILSKVQLGFCCGRWWARKNRLNRAVDQGAILQEQNQGKSGDQNTGLLTTKKQWVQLIVGLVTPPVYQIINLISANLIFTPSLPPGYVWGRWGPVAYRPPDHSEPYLVLIKKKFTTQKSWTLIWRLCLVGTWLLSFLNRVHVCPLGRKRVYTNSWVA